MAAKRSHSDRSLKLKYEVLQELEPEMYENINKSLMKWILHLRCENIPVNDVLLKKKACDFAKELRVSNFQASDG